MLLASLTMVASCRLKSIMRKKESLRVGAIINDYGEKDVDGDIVSSHGGGNGVTASASSSRTGEAGANGVVALPGGCVCCKSSVTRQFRQAVADFLQVPDHADGKLDYVVVETSGVTDPDSIIEALDEQFGKLTRARLDCVVAVLDGDAVSHGNSHLPATACGQVARADVILVNKNDLLTDEDRHVVEQLIRRVNPSAALHFCQYGEVPLHWVLDVELPEKQLTAVSHEVVSCQIFASSAGGNLRLLKSEQASPQGISPLKQKQKQEHLELESMRQVTFVPDSHVSLALFQDWVCDGIPRGTQRVKGFLSFAHCPQERILFNMSGRNRMSYEREGVWQGPPSQRLVLIGSELAEEGKIQQQLRTICPERSLFASPQSMEEAATALCDHVRADLLFDLVEKAEDGNDINLPGVILFRFTGEGAFKLSTTQLHVRYGVDLDAVNERIARTVNSRVAGDGNLFLTFLEVGGKLVLAWGLGGQVSLLERWKVLLSCARHVMAQDLAHVVRCNCIY